MGDKNQYFWIDMFHRQPIRELYEVYTPSFICGINERWTHWWLDQLIVKHLMDSIMCHFYGGNQQCGYSRSAADYLTRETLSSVGYGEMGPWSWDGDEGMCLAPTDPEVRNNVIQMRMRAIGLGFKMMSTKKEFMDDPGV